jgi:AcrR family transcriptional regulator
MRVNDGSITVRRKSGGVRPRRAVSSRTPAGLRVGVTEVYRRAILDAAEAVFGAHGFAQARMADIAEAAGMAAGTLYNYFPSKEAIFVALFEQVGEQLSALLAPIAAGAAAPREKLVQLTGATFAYVESHAAMLTLLLQMGGAACAADRAGSGPDFRRHYLRTLAVFQSTLTEGMRCGVVQRGLDPRELSAMLAGAMGGMVRAWLMGGRRGRLRDRATFLVDLFLTGAGPQ